MPKESRHGLLTDRLRLKVRLRRRRTLKSRRLERPRCGCVSAITEKHPPVAAAPLPHPASEQWPPTRLANHQNEHPLLPLASRQIQEEAGNSQQALGSANKWRVIHESCKGTRRRSKYEVTKLVQTNLGWRVVFSKGLHRRALVTRVLRPLRGDCSDSSFEFVSRNLVSSGARWVGRAGVHPHAVDSGLERLDAASDESGD